MIKGTVFDIQRFSIHDGPGIRTTVFLKGCPLNCIWCHNPESKSARPELMLHGSKCVGCGECVKACSLGLHSFEGGEHLIEREKCIGCGKCEADCVGALKLYGEQKTVSEVIDEVLRDKSFYDNSGGGMTVSGGEPLMQHEFTLALLKSAKELGLNTAIETSGFSKWERIEAIAPFVDLFLWDVKETDTVRHNEYTGVGNELILENLGRLSTIGARIVLRCPVIPGLNDREEHFRAIGALADALSGVERVDVEPYHPLGKSKALALGKPYPLEDLSFPEDATVKAWVESISGFTAKQVIKS